MTKVYENVSVIGIDGCKKGWCCCFDDKEKIKVIVIEKIDQFRLIFPKAQYVLIDIPIGLSSKKNIRDLDQFARQHLKPGRTSSVFTAPVRDAIFASSYQQACERNFHITGKKISIQCWNISKKILEVDNFLDRNKSMKSILHEAHPEICFKHLNYNELLSFSKHEKKEGGLKERLIILSKYHQGIYSSFDQAISTHKRKELKADDIVDSMCLYVVGQLGAKYGFDKIIGTSMKDEKDIYMKLFYFDPRRIKVF